jgi:DNA-binding PadR family transcriptional regulator
MYYELLVLGRLMYGACHGYFIADVMSDMLGPWQRVSTGTLYPLLARLERDGLIETDAAAAEPRSRRTPRSYTITEAGRARFIELMLDTTSSIGDYQRLFYLKVPHLEFLSAQDQIELLEHYRDYCRAAIRHQEKNTRNLKGWLVELGASGAAHPHPGGVSMAGLENAIETTRHWTTQWQADLAWVEHLLARIAQRR